MSVNPIKTLLNSIEKLIIEHGSAVIQEKHIILLKEQLSIADRESTKLITENSKFQSNEIDFQAEIDQLLTKIAALENDNADLKKKIQEYEQSIHDKLLDETAKSILNKLFETNREITINSFAKLLNNKESVMQYHIDNLLKNKLIIKGPRMLNGPTTYLITKEGRKYVVEILHI